jgi:hypothetical protein
LVLLALGCQDDALKAAHHAVELAPVGGESAMLFAVRAKVNYQMGNFADVIRDMVAAWRQDHDLVIALQEFHGPLLECFRTSAKLTVEERILFNLLSNKFSAATLAQSNEGVSLK